MSALEGSRGAGRRRILVPAGVVGVLAGSLLAVAIAMQPDTTAGGRDHIRAVLDGELIPAHDVGRYHCHDRDFPLIRCFTTEAARDADLEAEGTRP